MEEKFSDFEARVQRLEGKEEDQYWFVSKSSAMDKVNEWLTILRRESMRGDAHESTILIEGEVGVEKDGIARMIHAGSRRGKGAWIVLNCSAYDEKLLEAELFGFEKSEAQTSLKKGVLELANEGTLLLENVEHLYPEIQAKLFHALSHRSVRRTGGSQDISINIRVISTSSIDLKTKVQDGKFREDLFRRLSQVAIQVPSLRQRQDDIVPMATQFAEKSFRQEGRQFPGFSPEFEQVLRDYSWPGNTHELHFLIARVACLWRQTGLVQPHILQMSAHSANLNGSASPSSSPVAFETVDGTLNYTALKKKWSDSFEKEYLTAILSRHRGNVSAASREAKLDRSNFLRLLRRHGMKAEQYRKVFVLPQKVAA